ncbi:MAG TPA: CHAD domain-containing protein [Methylomirabilota bacterium]|nr:CHAD domain-containing protein [Methylomirabilota bacterium]
MSFELRIDEALPDGIHRIAKKEIEKVRECVDGSSKASRDEMVHEARKSLKKLRALVRLVRPGVGGKLYRRENFAFRDIARPLTEVRDAKILVEALDRTSRGNGDRPERRPFTKARGELVRHQREIRQKVLGDEEAFEGVDSAMKKALDRLDEWTDFHDGWSSVGQGVSRVYRRGRQAFAAATEASTVEHLHEWRKQAKYLRYELEVLRSLRPTVLGPLANRLDRLGELLGDDHDLAMLRREVAGDPERFGGQEAIDPLLGRIDQRRQRLERQAMRLGGAVFEEAPDAFVRRLRSYWKDSHAG